MITSATQSGVQDGYQPTEEEVAANPRMAAMARISAGNDARIEEELNAAGQGSSGADGGQSGGGNDGGGAGNDDQLQTQLQTERTVLAEGLDKVFVKSKIDGVETEVSVADMQREFQKKGAADKRLDEATRILRGAKETADKLKTPPVGNDDTAGGGNSSTASPDTNTSKASAKDLYQALVDGDEATAVAALEKLTEGGRPNGSTQTPEQLAAQVAPVVKQQITNESALAQFGTDFSDIAGDPYLATVADSFLAEEMKDGKSFPEALAASGQRTRDWLAAKAPKPEPKPEPTTIRQEKLVRKQGADIVTGVQGKAPSNEEPVQGPSDVIAEMRRQRGLN